MTTILYIAGAGRSGSTLLDIILGQHQEIFSCGELSNLSITLARNELCSCSEPVGCCSFWSSVAPKNPYDPYIEFHLNHSKSLSSWAHLLIGNKHKHYVDYLDKIYERVAINSGQSVIVDSSKSPIRLAALLKYSRHRIKVIHLVRHPANVAKSLSVHFSEDKSAGVQHEIKSKLLIRSFAFWAVINMMVDFVVFKFANRNVLRVNFKNLLTNPSSEVSKIHSYLSLKPQSFDFDQNFLNAEHIMSGNRMRMRKNIVFIRRDDVACKESFAYRAGTWITGPLIRKYNNS